MARPALSHQSHTQRAQAHFEVGCALQDAADNEWAAVCYFYAAYHLVQAALAQDPIFDDVTELKAIDPNLLPKDRHTSQHQVKKGPGAPGGRGWGVNDLVLKLYPQIVGDYDRLYQGSVAVRYRNGLLEGALPRLRESVDRIRAAAAAGDIVAGR